MRLVRSLVSGAIALAVFTSTHQLVRATPDLTYTKVWTHAHATPGQLSEIPTFDPLTNTIWVAGAVGVDVLDANTGALVTHIDVTAHGAVNSVAIHGGLAAFAVEAPSFSATCPSCDRRNPGKVLFYDTATRLPSAGVNEIQVGALPDMLTFTHNGRKLLVANEGTPNRTADADYEIPPVWDPEGTVSIINVEARTAVTVSLLGVPIFGSNVRVNTGMDFEPEYIAVDEDDSKAFVTLQEANAIAVLDLDTDAFTEIIGLGAKDFSKKGNEIDPKDNDGVVLFRSVEAHGLYMPDAVATYQSHGKTYLVMANEGDFREDNDDRSAASTFGAVTPLDRLRVTNTDSSVGDLFAAGARSFSIRTEKGALVYDSASLLDRAAHAWGVYDDGRSRDKGVEPEGVALLEIERRTYAFIGLERALKSAVAIFDITHPQQVSFVDLIVTDGDLSPEGLAAYKFGRSYYLAIANEVPAPGHSRTHTTLYRLQLAEED